MPHTSPKRPLVGGNAGGVGLRSLFAVDATTDAGIAAKRAGEPHGAQQWRRPASATAPPPGGDATVHAVSVAIVPECETP